MGYQPMTSDKSTNDNVIIDKPNQKPQSVTSSVEKPELNSENLKDHINQMQSIFGKLCNIMNMANGDDPENVDTGEVAKVFDDIAGSLKTMVGPDDKLFQTLTNDINKMKAECNISDKDK